MFRLCFLLVVAVATRRVFGEDYEFCAQTTIPDLGTGNVISPKFPAPYGNSADCYIEIEKSGNGSRRLELFVNDFNLERNFDFFAVYFDDVNYLSYTGDGENFADVNSNISLGVGSTYTYNTDDEFKLRFFSDGNTQSAGFNLTFTISETIDVVPPPTYEGPCANVTGSYLDEFGAEMILTQKDGFQVEGLFRRDGDPIFLGLIGFSGRADRLSNAIALNSFGRSSILSLNGLCKQCNNARYITVYETLVAEPDIQCLGQPLSSSETILRNFSQLGYTQGSHPKDITTKLTDKGDKKGRQQQNN